MDFDSLMLTRTPLIPILLAASAVARGGEIAVLYDPDRVPGTTETPEVAEQGFVRLSNDLFNLSGFYSAGDGVTNFDSGPELTQVAVFSTHGLITGTRQHPRAQTLDRMEGFRVSFDLAILSEEHDESIDANGDGVIDNAGFSIGIICSDLLDGDRGGIGIGIQFWMDRIWSTEDDAMSELDLLTQAESISQTTEQMSTVRRYHIEVKGDAYRLRVGGKTLLKGRLRNYSNFPGFDIGDLNLNSFDKPNSITFGDATQTSRSQASIGEITSETPYNPPPEPTTSVAIEPTHDGQFQLSWDSIPGVLYSIQTSDDLREFIELADASASQFRTSYTDLRPVAARRFYRIVPLNMIE